MSMQLDDAAQCMGSLPSSSSRAASLGSVYSPMSVNAYSLRGLGIQATLSMVSAMDTASPVSHILTTKRFGEAKRWLLPFWQSKYLCPRELQYEEETCPGPLPF